MYRAYLFADFPLAWYNKKAVNGQRPDARTPAGTTPEGGDADVE